MKKAGRLLFRVLRLLPLTLMAAGALWLLISDVEISFDALLHYAPEDMLQAALFLWLAFAVKSLSLLCPVLLLFAVTGYLFPLPVALAVNTVGVAITVTLPYLAGRLSGPDLTERLRSKYPRLEELRSLRRQNSLFFSFIVRAIGILPCDVMSLYMGNTRLPYPQYLAGAVLGFLPDLLCATVAGMKLSDISSPWFWLSIAVNLILCAAAFFFYRSYRRRHIIS